MTNDEIVHRCVSKLGMSPEEGQWVADHVYDYFVPDWSEWSWQQIDQCLGDVLFFRGKTDEEVEAWLGS